MPSLLLNLYNANWPQHGWRVWELIRYITGLQTCERISLLHCVIAIRIFYSFLRWIYENNVVLFPEFKVEVI